jgi:hypothetical protein
LVETKFWWKKTNWFEYSPVPVASNQGIVIFNGNPFKSFVVKETSAEMKDIVMTGKIITWNNSHVDRKLSHELSTTGIILRVLLVELEEAE